MALTGQDRANNNTIITRKRCVVRFRVHLSEAPYEVVECDVIFEV